jgi:hypothetical protein
VTHDEHHLRPGELRGELHAAEDVRILDVAGDPGVEDVAHAEVEEDLRRSARIDAAEQYAGGKLPGSRGLLLGKEVPLNLPSFTEAEVALLPLLEDLVRRHLVARFLGQRHDGRFLRGGLHRLRTPGAKQSDRRRCGGRLNKDSPRRQVIQIALFSFRHEVGLLVRLQVGQRIGASTVSSLAGGLKAAAGLAANRRSPLKAGAHDAKVLGL